MVRNLTYHQLLGESDHACIAISLGLINNQQKQNTVPSTTYSKTNYAAVKKVLPSYHRQSVPNTDFKNDYRIFIYILTLELKEINAYDKPTQEEIYMTRRPIRLKTKK